MEKTVKRTNRIYRLLSFLIPFGVMLLALAAGGFYPFGKLSMFRGDASVEYYPYIIMFRRIIQSHESLFYTWRSGLGISLIPTFGYFGFNPFNLIAYFLPESVLPAYFSVTICVRIALAGYFFSILLQTIRQKLTPAAVAFSVMFALNSWMIGNSLQLVWLDSIALLPLICAGLVRAVRNRDYRLYIPALGFCIAFNYYIGFIICVMTGLAWLALLIVDQKPLRTWFAEALRFLGTSAVGAGIGAVLLIPTALVLHQTSTFGDTVTNWKEFYCSIPMLIGSLSPFLDIALNTQPGYYASSILAVLLLGGYLVSEKLPLRERLCGLAVFLFIMLSIWYAPLNFVWHGLHYPHISVQRFGFLVPFVLAFMGWRFTDTLHDLPEKTAGKGITALRIIFGGILMLGFAAGVIYCAAASSAIDIPLVAAVFAGLYFLLYAFYRFCPKRVMPFYLCLLVLVCGELGLNFYLQNTALKTSAAWNYVIPDESIKQAAAAVSADIKSTPDSFGRTALNYPGIQLSDEELIYDIPQGSSVFNSLIPHEQFLFCEKMGFQSDHEHGYCYLCRRLNPFAALLSDMQYAVSSQPVSGYDVLDSDRPDEKFHAYKAQQEMPLGFCIPDLIQLPSDHDMLACEAQSQLFQEMTGLDLPLFTKVPEYAHQSEGMTLNCSGERYDYQTFGIQNDMESEEKYHPSLKIEFRIPEDGSYYWYSSWDAEVAGANNVKLYTIRLNDDVVSEFAVMSKQPLRCESCAVGNCKKGDKVTFETKLFAGSTASLTVHLVKFNDEAYEKGYEILHESPLKLTSFSQDEFTGTVDAKKDSVLYLSLPYDEGWSAYADGKQVPVERVLDAMSGIRVSAGTHQIRMRFRPKGLITGAAVSGACILIYLILCIVYAVRLHKQKTAAVPAAAEEKPAAQES